MDFYAVTIPTGGTYIFNQTSATFDTYLAFLTSTNVLVGINDDYLTTSTDSRLKVIVPAGSYFIGANSYDREHDRQLFAVIGGVDGRR